jgi:hypothetical protein
MYSQSQCHYRDQENGGSNNYRLTHGVIVADRHGSRSPKPGPVRSRNDMGV